tara:strand:+ start:171 stop:629 length:459 start_codon:yes stop_codon:yes gene_type:complete
MKHQIKIGDIKIPLLNDYFKRRGFIHNEIVSSWETLTENFSKYTTPLKIKFPKNKVNDGTLFIKVKSGLGPELEMHTKKIIDKINSKFGYKAINKIKLQNGDFKYNDKYNEKKVLEPVEKSKLNSKLYVKIKNIKNQSLAEALLKLGKEIPK